jgi:hypothetical protein
LTWRNSKFFSVFGHLREVGEADADLALQRELTRRAHLARHGQRQVAAAFLVDLDDAVEELETFSSTSLKANVRKARLAAATALSTSALEPREICANASSVDGSMTSNVWAYRIDPGAIDIKLQLMCHVLPPVCSIRASLYVLEDSVGRNSKSTNGEQRGFGLLPLKPLARARTE